MFRISPKHIYLIGSLVSGVLLAENTVVKVPGSANNWPMAGGPDGSWIVDTDLPVPTDWSVRSGKNVKWTQALPAGGQSGIAVWGDQLFLTINPPLDVPSHAEVERLYKEQTAAYAKLYPAALSQLMASGDAEFVKRTATLEQAKTDFAAMLEADNAFQKAKGNQAAKLRETYLWKKKEGKALGKAQKAVDQLVYQQDPATGIAFDALDKTTRLRKSGASGTDVILICMDANTGDELWTRPVRGLMSSGYNYGFSDSTTPCPMTDGQHVWVVNASGGMACFDLDGDLKWERTWMPSGGRPFNKQFDSIMYGDWILNLEPPLKGDSSRVAEWNYLHAFDKQTGRHAWVSDAALTHYNTPVLGQTASGLPAVLIGRGGPHGVPERPVGLSLVSLNTADAGTSIWDWEAPDPNSLSGWGALSTQLWDQEKASWFYKGQDHLTIDTTTGKLIDRKALTTVDEYRYDTSSAEYVSRTGVTYKNLNNLRHCNMSVGDYVFLLYRDDPIIVRHNVKTGKNEQLELPGERDEEGNFLWGLGQTQDGLNAKGQRLRCDARTQGHGFQKCFLGTPTLINDDLYITTAIGIVYVINTKAEIFDASAIVAVNDLGRAGETWTVNSLSFANGCIYHRTMKDVICISPEGK